MGFMLLFILVFYYDIEISIAEREKTGRSEWSGDLEEKFNSPFYWDAIYIG